LRKQEIVASLSAINHNIYIMKMRRLSTRTAGRPRKQPSARKRAISATVSPATVKKMDAVRLVHIQNRFSPPGDSWMVEQGLEQYFQFELARFPQLQALFANIEQPLSVVGSIRQNPPTSNRPLEGGSPSGKGQGA
jgi:hypothetical protein